MASTCLTCGGTFKTVDGRPCPNCEDENLFYIPSLIEVPIQYQGVMFDKSFLPKGLQSVYGDYMENLLQDIVNNIDIFQKNIMICCRPNSGKTVWAYSLYSLLMNKGIKMPPLKDIIEVRNFINSYDAEENKLFSSSRVAIIKIPSDPLPWIFDIMLAIVERRVRSNGFTIFFYSGDKEDLKHHDKGDKLKYIKGTGSYNSVDIKYFC